MRYFTIFQVLVLVSVFPPIAHALSLETMTGWEGIFAGKVTPYEIRLKSKQNQYLHLSWTLNLKGRILSRGEQDVRFLGHDTVSLNLPLHPPPLKPGIKLDADLFLDLTGGEQSDERIRQKFKLKLYGPDPLLSELPRLKKLNIRLYDPNGHTSEIFDNLKIPYTAVSKSELSDSHVKGLLVVGIGLTFKRQTGLLDLLVKQAEKGDRILILQPVSGSFPLPGATGENVGLPSSIAFSDQRIFSRFADGLAWNSIASVKTSGLRIEPLYQAVMVQVVESAQDGWSWVDIFYNRSGGRFIVSMFPFEKHIRNGPVPQLMFAHLLAYIAGQPVNEFSNK